MFAESRILRGMICLGVLSLCCASSLGTAYGEPAADKALLQAIQKGNVAAVKGLFEQFSPDANKTYYFKKSYKGVEGHGKSPLIYALTLKDGFWPAFIKGKQLEIAEILLKNGADPNFRWRSHYNCDGREQSLVTYLLLESYKRQRSYRERVHRMLDALLAAGADVHAKHVKYFNCKPGKSKTRVKSQETIFDGRVRLNADVFALLVRHGLEFEKPGVLTAMGAMAGSEAKVKEIWETAFANGNLSPDSVDAKGRTALHTAARAGRLWLVNALLEKGARIDVEDEEDRQPLHYALQVEGPFREDRNCQSKEMKGRCMYPEVAELLVAQGANVNHLADGMTTSSVTPVSLAIDRAHSQESRYLPLIKVMTMLGADLNGVCHISRTTVRDKGNKQTALQYALKRRAGQKLKALLRESGAKDTPDTIGR